MKCSEAQILCVLAAISAVHLGKGIQLRLISLYTFVGQEVIYECTVTGTGATTWQGTALEECPKGNIFLRHSDYRPGYELNKTCGNSGLIRGRAVSAENEIYTSRLILNVSDYTVGDTIECSGGSEEGVQRARITLSNGQGELEMINSCSCPGHDAIYKCTVHGGGATIWLGTTLQTVMQGCINDPSFITLNHSDFNSGQTVTKTCGIFGLSISIQTISSLNDTFKSQLTLMGISQQVNGTTLECTTDNGLNHASNQILLTTDPFKPPSNVTLSNADDQQFTFSWYEDTLLQRCPTLNYSVSSNCGHCPSKTTSTNAICMLTRQEKVMPTCSFRIQTEICDSILSDKHELTVHLIEVPGKPSVTPLMFSNSRVFLNTTFTKSSSSELSSNNFLTVSYRLIFTDSIFGELCGTETLLASEACGTTACMRALELPSSCYNYTFINVTVSAINILGIGPPSTPFMVGIDQKSVINHAQGSPLTTVLSVLVVLGGVLTLLVSTAFFLVLRALLESKKTINTLSAQQKGQIDKDTSVIYDEVNQHELVASSEINVKQNSAYEHMTVIDS